MGALGTSDRTFPDSASLQNPQKSGASLWWPQYCQEGRETVSFQALEVHLAAWWDILQHTSCLCSLSEESGGTCFCVAKSWASGGLHFSALAC